VGGNIKTLFGQEKGNQRSQNHLVLGRGEGKERFTSREKGGADAWRPASKSKAPKAKGTEGVQAEIKLNTHPGLDQKKPKEKGDGINELENKRGRETAPWTHEGGPEGSSTDAGRDVAKNFHTLPSWTGSSDERTRKKGLMLKKIPRGKRTVLPRIILQENLSRAYSTGTERKASGKKTSRVHRIRVQSSQ